MIQLVIEGKFTENRFWSYKKCYEEGIDITKLKFHLVTFETDQKTRFDIEAKFAIDNRVERWRTAPGYQTRFIHLKED